MQFVSTSFGEGVLCLIDRNGSFPSACSAVPPAPNKLLHTGPLDAFDRGQAGIYQAAFRSGTTRACRTRSGDSPTGRMTRAGHG
ncbi:hypothetical protein AB0M86_46430 [Streptomyces sp. NPDC051639]|uniref:hypothetical protein n=1 Tax=Streptomyces sp. NPDC051639 TaxID=3155671 RepID=UPI002001DFA3|nr:hypothetical protein [Streptomyces sp. RPA4-2]